MDVIKDIFTFLLEHYALYLLIVMSATTTLIIVIINLTKKLFKRLTSKISNERLRLFVNRVIIFAISFGLSFGFWFLLNWISPEYFVIDYKEIFLNGILPIALYAFYEGWITGDKAKKIIKGTLDAIADDNLTKEEAKEIVKETSEALDAEKELNKLLKK